MVLFYGVRVQIRIFCAQLRNYTVEQQKLSITYLKIYTAFSEALNVSGWDTISLDYKFQIFKLLYRASKVSLPECLINNIFKRRECSYSPRDQEAITIPRFNTRLLKDSLAHRGAVLWNFVNHYVKNVGSIDPKKLRSLLRRNDHFRSFTLTGLSGSTVRNRLTDYTYF